MIRTLPTLSFFCGLGLTFIAPTPVHAQFTLNFQPHGGPDGVPEYYCNQGGISTDPCKPQLNSDDEYENFFVDNEPTPFLMENVNINGVRYIHYVVGDPNDGFAMEVYIRGQYNRSPDSKFSDFASPFASAQNGPGGGAGKGPLTERVPVIDPETGEEVIDPATGKVITTDISNGRGNPTKIVIRQVLGGEWDGTSLTCDSSEFCSEFLKDSELTKPSIRQTVNSGTVTAEFAMDMRAISYDDINTMAPIVNTVTFADSVPGGFDMVTDVDVSIVSGGRYTYTPGNERQGSLGIYQYWDGGFNMENIKWETYRDPFTNPEINVIPYPNEF